MAIKNTKRLVIDTDIAQAVGTKNDPRSRGSLLTFRAVLNLCHQVVLTDAIDEEWARHTARTREFNAWYIDMRRRKDKVARLKQVINDELRLSVEALDFAPTVIADMMKDIHLLEAALAADKIILSSNDRERRRFKAAADEIEIIQEVIWVNPIITDENVIDWLGKGAIPEKERMLGFKSE